MSGRPAARRRSSPGPVPRPGERGAGLVGTISGVAAFLAFLLLAVQVLFNLYATSVVSANGYDAARRVAAYQADRPDGAVPADRIAEAEAEARARFGAYAERVRFDWSGTDADTVRLHLTADNPRLMIFGSHALGSNHIDRTIVVRVERFR